MYANEAHMRSVDGGASRPGHTGHYGVMKGGVGV
jgi:hypothetical protein